MIGRKLGLEVCPAALLLLALSCAEPDAGDTAAEASSFAHLQSPALPIATLEDAVERGIELYFQAEYDSARSALRSAFEQARERADEAVAARALTWLGLAAWRQGRFDEATTLGREALRIKLNAGLNDQLYRSYNALGLVAWHQSRLSEAAEMFGRALEAARAVGDEPGVAGAAGNLGLVYTDLGEFDAAREGFTTLRDAGRALGSPVHEANGLTNLGMLYVLMGDPASAIPLLDKARELYRAEAPANEIVPVRQLGEAYALLGELSRAHAMYDTALAMARVQGDRQEEAANLEFLAELYQGAGDWSRALDLYGRARQINADLGMQLETGAVLYGQAQVHHRRGDLERAEADAREARRIHREIGAPLEELQDVVLLAELAHLDGREADVARRLREARELATSIDAGIARITAALGEARIADAAEEPEVALAALSRVDADLTRGDYASTWEANALRARAYFRIGQLDSAADAGRIAVATVQRVRGSLASDVLRTSFTAARIRTHADLVNVLLRQGRIGEAFEVADAARGRTLEERLTSARQDDLALDPSASDVARGELLLRRIDQLVASVNDVELAEVSGIVGSDEVLDRVERLVRARNEYEALLVNVAEARSRSAALLAVAPTRLGDVQLALRPGEALLDYLVTPDRLIAFVVTQDVVQLAETPVAADDLRAKVRLAREFLSEPDVDNGLAGEILEALYDVVIEPAARAAAIYEAHTLLLVSHDVLNYLPFAALRDRSTGRYLAEDFTLIDVPSAAALAVLRDRQDRLSPRPTAGYAVAPFPDRLPATRGEAEAVSRAVPATVLLLGAGGTESRLRRALATEGIVHVASHAVLNPANPMFSRVELQPGTKERREDDGWLEVHELLGLRIRAPFIFLSGCETGLGSAWSTDFESGEDYATLARAFLYAGGRNVVATLWRLEDESAAAFADLFYGELASRAPAEAIARAQRQMLARPGYASPYYWAGYRLTGSGS